MNQCVVAIHIVLPGRGKGEGRMCQVLGEWKEERKEEKDEVKG